jgi:SAM-dependent methyltransferase
MDAAFPELEILSYSDIDRKQSEAIFALGKKLGRPVSILEAGCGRHWRLDLMGTECTLTGVDLDPEALALRKNKMRDLDVAIHGDLCTVDFPEASFDVVFSRFVLEHVEKADVALRNFVRWLKPGGLLIVLFPVRESARTFYARFLPYRFHLWFYRYVIGNKLAGRDGQPPYPTHFHPIIGGALFRQFLIENKMECLGRYGAAYERKWGVAAIVQKLAVKPIAAVTFGKLIGDYHNIAYIAVKSAQDAG